MVFITHKTSCPMEEASCVGKPQAEHSDSWRFESSLVCIYCMMPWQDVNVVDASSRACSIPILIHEDGVPWHVDTVTFWSWCTPLTIGDSFTTRTCIVGVPSSRLHAQSRSAILDVLKWDLQNLFDGTHPASDHQGRPFQVGSARCNLAGSRILPGHFRGVFSGWKGDSEAAVPAHHLYMRHYRTKFICDWCWASQTASLKHLSYGDFTRQAAWRATSCLTTLADPSPWKAVPGYNRSRRLWDALHVLGLGTIRDIVASVLAELLESQDLARFVGLPGVDDGDKILYRYTVQAQTWARTNGLELGIKPLSMNRLSISSHTYPELCSRVKAARGRVLFEYVVRTSLLVASWHFCFSCLYINVLTFKELTVVVLCVFSRGDRPIDTYIVPCTMDPRSDQHLQTDPMKRSTTCRFGIACCGR